jgi:phage-related protein (TIGR01555 family)
MPRYKDKTDPNIILDKIIKDEVKNLTPFRNVDNWSNILTGLNQRTDKSRYTTFSGYNILDDAMLAEIWVGDGIGKKLITIPVNDMTKEWFKIPNDPDGLINTELERLDTKSHIRLAMYWQGLFGGGINVIGINDGNELDKPVNKNTIKSIDWLRTYDRTEAAITEYHFNEDINASDYGELQYLTIQPKYTAPYNVHVDRLLIWKGLPVPTRIEIGDFYYWGMSELQSIWKQLSNLGASIDHIVKILYEFIVGKYKIAGLDNLIAEGNRKKVEDIIAIIELAKSTINATIIGENDDYTRDSANVSGLPELLDRYMMMLSGARGIPVVRLFGRSAAGMNATGEGDEKVYYDMIRAEQPMRMNKNLNKLIEYINISIGNKIEKPIIEYNSLFQQTLKEELECKKLQAETDHIYIQDGVLTSEEVTENRFGGDEYSYDTVIDMDNREDIMAEEKERLEMELEAAKQNNKSNKELEENEEKSNK